MRRVKKLFSAIVLSLITMCCVVFGSTQISTAEGEDYTYETFFMVMERYGLKTAKNLSGCSDVVIEEIIPVIGFDSIQSGFMFSFTRDSKPFGYMILDLMKEDPVVNFSFEDGKEDIYSRLINELERKDVDISNIKKVILYDGMTGYYLFDSDNVYNQSGECIFFEEVLDGATIYSSASSIFRTYNSANNMILTLTNSGYVMTQNPKLISNPVCYTQADALAQTGKYACGVLGLTQIVKRDGLSNDSLATIFEELWDIMDATCDTITPDYCYGSTGREKPGPAYVEYAQKRHKSVTFVKENSPSSNFFKAAVNADRSSSLGYSIYTSAENKLEGHFVYVIGYAQTKSKTSGNYYNYLIVEDGWDGKAYVNYTQVDMYDCVGFDYYSNY